MMKRRMKTGMGLLLILLVFLTVFEPQTTAFAEVAADAPAVVVVLDPGHGGIDKGAHYKWNGKTYTEKQLNLAIAKACKAELETYAGVKVYMTRSSDRYVTLSGRVNYAKAKSADLFVSLHNNASRTKSERGACVYYPNQSYEPDIGSEGELAAASIQEELVACGLKDNGILFRNSESGARYADRSKADYYAVIKRSKLAGFPGLIVEHAYVSNASDCTTYFADNDQLTALGTADATGIAAYFDLVKNGTPTLQEPVVNADGTVALTWDAMDGMEAYRVYRRVAGAKTYVCLDETEETGFVDETAKAGVNYEYTVCGVHEGYLQDSYTTLAPVAVVTVAQ